MSEIRRVKFLKAEWRPETGDRQELSIEFLLIEEGDTGKERSEFSQTRRRRIVVGISRSLEKCWGLGRVDLEKVLFEYAKRHIKNKVRDNTLGYYEELQLNSYNTSLKCPYDPANIKIEFNVEEDIRKI